MHAERDGEGAALIVVAAGTGRRLGADRHKALVSFGGRTLAEFTLARLLSATWNNAPLLDPVVLVGHPDDRDELNALVSRQSRTVLLVDGGTRRQDSVAAGLQALPGRTRLVLVHDAARPFVPLTSLPALIEAAAHAGAALLALPVTDTIKEAHPAPAVSGTTRVLRTVPRERLWSAQTPQAFSVTTLSRLLDQARARGVTVTDEASLFETAGLPVALVQGSRLNFKITTEEDLAFARTLLEEERQD